MPRLLIALLLASTAAAGEWTQWRGPDRDGVVPTLPASLEGLKKEWSVELQPSYSGPLTDGRLVFTTQTVDKSDEVVTAHDIATGEEVWRASWPGSMSVPFFAAANGSWIRATPALADGRLYVAGMKDVLVCLDAATGKELWRKDFVEDMGTSVPPFGNVCSPLVRGGLVIVQSANAVVALDAGTGELKWKALAAADSMMSGGAFSSPIMAEDAPGGPQLLAQTRTTLAGLNPETGEVVWQTPVEAFRGMNILTPTYQVVDGDLQVFTSTYGGGSTLFNVKDGRGEVSKVWNAKPQGYMSTPVLVGQGPDARVVLNLRNQRATALRWRDGEVLWTSKPYGKYWSNLTDGANVLALDQTGQLLLIDPSGEEMTVLSSRKVSDAETWAHVGWTGDRLLVRRLDGLDVYAAE